jgi:hypothetical protein
MDMQDKDIDQLFRSQLDSLEVEPSAQAWDNIASAINPKKSRLNTYLSIAASLLMILGAGWYFISGTSNVAKKPVHIVKVKKQGPAKQVVAPQVISPEALQPQLYNNIAAIKAPALARKKVKRDIQKQTLQATKPEIINQPNAPLAQVALPVSGDTKFVVPDKQTPLVVKVDVPDDTQFKTSADAPVIPATKTIAAVPAKKHRIHSLGDLINVMVSKVDKRKDKLIEFSSSKDEDESVVSGLNLGFIKIKKEDK